MILDFNVTIPEIGDKEYSQAASWGFANPTQDILNIAEELKQEYKLIGRCDLLANSGLIFY